MDADGTNLRELKPEGVLNAVLPWDGPEWRRPKTSMAIRLSETSITMSHQQ